MSNKEELSRIIKDWVNIDNDIKVLQKELKERRNNKKMLTNSLVEIMKTNEIDCFDINNGKIIYSKNNVKKSITKKHLLDSLHKFFNDTPGIDCETIAKYILDKREITIKDNIRLKNK
jgi:hypothetical protein